MDVVYAYHHPTSTDTNRDGFMNPFSLVIEGWKEYKATGRYPDPIELAKRLNSTFRDDIDTFDKYIEQGRPKEPPTP